MSTLSPPRLLHQQQQQQQQQQQHPMDRVLYNLHYQLSTAVLRRTSSRARSLMESAILILAVCTFGALLLAHISFVYGKQSSRPTIAASCLPSIPGFSKHCDVTHITLVTENSWAVTVGAEGTLPFCASTDTASSIDTDFHSYYSYSQVKGYLFVPPYLCQARNITIQYVGVSRSDVHCFGEPFLQKLVFSVLGPEVVMRNWLVAIHNATGFLYNPRTDTLIDLTQTFVDARSTTTPPLPWTWTYSTYATQLMAKLTVILKTSFLYFITTTLVSFTLRETQERMLDFTHQLHALVRSRRPVVHLVTTHLVENLVFCPVMVGIIFFLIEFYRGDKILAFSVLSVVWLCEVFSVIR
jgi:hypothetical protein